MRKENLNPQNLRISEPLSYDCLSVTCIEKQANEFLVTIN